MKQTVLLLLTIFTISCTKKNQIIKPDLKAEIQKNTTGKKATVAVSVLGIDFPLEYHNENTDKKLPMQSVFKFHIALAVLDLVDKGQLSLDQKVFIKKSELLENTHSPIREKHPEGNFEMPVSELLEYTVAMSDNIGCDVLLRLIGGPKVVHDYLISKGMKDTQIVYNEEIMQKEWKNQYENYTTMKSATVLLKDFYNGKMVSKKSTEFLLGVMHRTSTGINRLKKELPEKTKIAHKTGSSSTKDGVTAATNDMGIITLPNGKKYAISVFVNDSKENEETNEKLISDISKAVYNFLQST